MNKIIQGIILFLTNTLGITVAYNALFGNFDNLHLAFLILNLFSILTQVLVIIYKDSLSKGYFKKLIIKNVLLYSLLVVANQFTTIADINLVTPTIIFLSAYLARTVLINLSEIEGFPIPKFLIDIINSNVEDKLAKKEDIDKIKETNKEDKKEDNK